MSLIFRLNNRIVNVEANASFLSVVGDLDTGNATLAFKKYSPYGAYHKNPIAPGTPFSIEDDELNDIWNFIILNDEVEIVKKASLGQQVYKHNVSLVSKAHVLSHYALRNTVFNNTIAENKIVKFNLSGILYTHVETYTDAGGFSFKAYEIKDGILYPCRAGSTVETSYLSYYLNRVKVPARERIKNLELKLTGEWTSFNGYRLGDNAKVTLNTAHVHGSARVKCTCYLRIYNSSTSNVPIVQYQIDYNAINQDVFVVPPEWYEPYQNQEIWIDIAPDEHINPELQWTAEVNDLRFEDLGSSAPYVPADGDYPNIFGAIHAELNIQTYYYTLYDILDILQKQSCKRRFSNTTNTRDTFTMPARDSEQGAELDGIIAPDFTFTGSNIFSAVAEVFSYIDAYPTLDENNVLGYEYLNDYSETELEELNQTDRKSSLSFNDYANKFISKYQSGRQTNSIFYPAKNVFKRPSANNYGVPAKDSYCYRVGYKIDYLDKVKVKYDGQTLSTDVSIYTDAWQQSPGNPLRETVMVNFLFASGEIDVTDMFYPSDVYGTLPRADADTTFPSQLNTVYYERGTDYIYMGAITDTNGNRVLENVFQKGLQWCMKNYYGVPTAVATQFPSLYGLKLNVEYHPIYDGQIAMESIDKKFDGEVEVAQNNGNAQLNRMGSNMQGLLARSGNASKNVVLPVTPYGSRMKKGTIWIDDDGNKYIANKVKTTFSTSSQKTIVEAEFTKNFNLLTQFTRIDREKRFYEINNNLISKGYENLTEYLMFSTKSYPLSPVTNNKRQLMYDLFFNTFATFSNVRVEEINCVDFAIFSSYEWVDSVDTKGLQIYIPMHVYGAGNMICFEVGYNSPVNAVDRLALDNLQIICQPCLYAGEDGFADKVLVEFLSVSSQTPVLEDNFPYLSGYAPYNPEISFDLNYYKKPNEIFHVNYEMAFLPMAREEIFFGPMLIENNGIIRGNRKQKTLPLYLYAGSEKYSIVDKKALTSNRIRVYFDIQMPVVDKDYAILHFAVLSGSTDKISGKAWCIGDEDGNIFIAVNNELTNANEVTIYCYGYFTRP